MPYAVPLQFVIYFTPSADTDSNESPYLSWITVRISVYVYSFVFLLYIIQKQNFGQPLQGEFQSSSQLSRITRQLSGFKNNCTTPLHRISLFSYMCYKIPFLPLIVNRDFQITKKIYLYFLRTNFSNSYVTLSLP